MNLIVLNENKLLTKHMLVIWMIVAIIAFIEFDMTLLDKSPCASKAANGQVEAPLQIKHWRAYNEA
jgi:hypothetical protein